MADGPDPGQLVLDSVQRCLGLAATGPAWDGRPMARTAGGRPSAWTPYKALRRISDHLTGHPHEAEALLAGSGPIPDEWHGRLVTLDADRARFTGLDYAEACSRLRRLGRVVRAALPRARGGGLGRAPARRLDAARDRRARGRGDVLRRPGRRAQLRIGVTPRTGRGRSARGRRRGASPCAARPRPR